jgi:hypothetical protein
MLHGIVPKLSKGGEAAWAAAFFNPNVVREPWRAGSMGEDFGR